MSYTGHILNSCSPDPPSLCMSLIAGFGAVRKTVTHHQTVGYSRVTLPLRIHRPSNITRDFRGVQKYPDKSRAVSSIARYQPHIYLPPRSNFHHPLLPRSLITKPTKHELMRLSSIFKEAGVAPDHFMPRQIAFADPMTQWLYPAAPHHDRMAAQASHFRESQASHFPHFPRGVNETRDCILWRRRA